MRGITRTRWAAIGAAVAVTLGGGGIGLSQAAIGTGEKPVYVALDAPCRLVDTRPAPNNIGPKSTPIGAGDAEAYTIQVTGANGNCVGPLAIPADAVAVATNVTVIQPNGAADGRSYFTIYPSDAARPVTSNLNFVNGQAPTPNKVDVGLSADGKVTIYNNAGTAHAAVDVFGYYVDHHHDDRYYTEAEVDAALDTKADSAEVDTALDTKADRADVYTEAEVDALIAGIPSGGGDPASYDNVIVVAKSGGDFTTVTAAMSAIGSDPAYPAASTSERYLVWVAPGVYENEDVDMKPFVDIAGSGQGVTVLRSVGGANGITPNAATLVGASDAELRDITVEITAAAPSNWTHAIYTAGSTRFHRVTAVATGGAEPRGIMVNGGGSPVLIDVIARASGGSVSNLAVDIVSSTMSADGLYAEATGGTNTRGIFVNSASSEVLLENVTTVATGASTSNHGLSTSSSDVTVEGLRAIVNASSNDLRAVTCAGSGHRLQILSAVVYAENGQGGAAARGTYSSGCDLELRNAVVDAVANGFAIGVQFVQNSASEVRYVTISDLEARAESSNGGAVGLVISPIGSPTDVSGRVTDVAIRASGGSGSANTTGINQSTVGQVLYRDVSIVTGGTSLFMYGIQASEGSSQFDHVTIEAVGAAEATVFGAELFGAGTALTNARVRAVNTDSGSNHDAVGIKANSSTGVVHFADVVAEAQAETNVWGVDVTNADATLTRVSATALGAPGNTVRGARCSSGTVTIDNSVLEAFAASAPPSLTTGLALVDCSGEATGTDLIADPSATTSWGLVANTGTGSADFQLSNSDIFGGTAAIVTSGASTVTVASSTLAGGPSSASGTSTQTCTGVVAGGGASFLAGPAACP